MDEGGLWGWNYGRDVDRCGGKKKKNYLRLGFSFLEGIRIIE